MNARPNPGRGRISLAVLLALVLAVTLQLVTGFLLQARFNALLLTVHIDTGIAAAVLLGAEWLWLLGTRSGRGRLAGFVNRSGGPAAWSDGAFLLVVTATVVLGLLLACVVRGGPPLPFAPMLAAHRALAVTVAVLYVVHGLTTARARRAGRA